MSKRARILIAFFALFIGISMIQGTYAKYISNASTSTNISVARWSILLNDQDVKNNSNFQNIITPIFSGNSHIKDGVIAPTGNGYFDITINGDDTDVSFRMTLDLSISKKSKVQDLRITKYTINNNPTEYTFDGNYQIQKDFLLNDNSKTITYRFFVEWFDGLNETMDNSKDTQAADQDAIFDVNANFIQLVG